MIARAVKKFKPPEKISPSEWANKYRFLSEKASAKPGKYSTTLTPWVPGMLDVIIDPNVREVVCQKSAQVAWTDGVLNNYIGYRIDIDPCPIIVMFAKEQDAKGYSKKKLTPMVEVTPVLSKKVDVSSSRKADNTALFKNFDGGFLELVGSGSPGSVKSTPAPVAAVEEPDDCQGNVKDQGDSITLLRERLKTYSNGKFLFGGTPAVKGLSRVEERYNLSDKRKFYVPCHECGESHVLHWDNVIWDKNADVEHSVYGKSQPETAQYVCPECACPWNDVQKNRNVRKGKWIAEGELKDGIVGFYINELYSPFEASKLRLLVKKYLEALYKQSQGDDRDIVVFINSTLGLPYEYASDAPDMEKLKERSLDYRELTVPSGGLVLTAGIDVQHDRLAIIIRAWGRDEESWLVFWGELYGNTAQKDDPVWTDSGNLLFRAFESEDGFRVGIGAISIDSSDGVTSDAVYHWARKYKKRGVMAIKGSSLSATDKEIFSLPAKSVDTNRKNSKASRYGLRPYSVGTGKAKDVLSARLKLLGNGPARMHWYEDVRQDYFEQITSEIKAPHRSIRGRLVWQKKSGVRNEALDCEVYALHAARSLKLHLYKPSQWEDLIKRLMQVDLFSVVEDEPEISPAPKLAKKKRIKKTGYMNSWRQ